MSDDDIVLPRRPVLPRTTTLRDGRRPHPSPPPTAPSIDTRRDELLRFPAAITSASDAELDLVLGRVDESIAPGTLDALLERAAAALRRARSEVAGSITSRGDDDAWTAAINAATLATRALRRCSRDTLRFLCRRRRPIASAQRAVRAEERSLLSFFPLCSFSSFPLPLFLNLVV